MALPNDILNITQGHIEQFITDQTREDSHLDFKRNLPEAWNDGAKHEFLADTTAFANSGGGDLIFGIEEDGQAQAMTVIPQILANVDQEVRRLQDFLLNLTEPRLPSVKVHAVPVSVAGINGHVIIVRISQSWAGPHRVKTNQHFYIRDGLRKRQLDILKSDPYF
jgi:predicted HTH transcriptional regulator